MPAATVSTARPGVDFRVGTSIPPATPHAVSVSLPRWQDNLDYEEGRLKDVMEIGYPRFFIHRSIQKLAAVLLSRFGRGAATSEQEAEDCILVPTKRVADSCRSFMQSQHALQVAGSSDPQQPLPVRSVQVCLNLPASSSVSTPLTEDAMSSSWSSAQNQDAKFALDDCASTATKLSVHLVLFPKSSFPLAKAFWQHTGDGISSRMAEAFLDLLGQRGVLGTGANGSTPSSAPISPSGSTNGKSANDTVSSPTSTVDPQTAFMKSRSYSRNRHYARNGTQNASASNGPAALSTTTASLPSSQSEEVVDALCSDHSTYLEERYGRNMAHIEAPRAKRALRKRIAGMGSDDAVKASRDDSLKTASASETKVDILTRSASETLSEDDVYLYPTGMSAIFHAHQLALRRRDAKSVCFGFPYMDTLKILQKWGPGCFFLGQGDADDLTQLETLLQAGQAITSLFCEFPSNPLLRSPDLKKLRALADTYDFLIVVDETIGNFVNVEVLPYADIVVSSLTKLFSGEANGMGGSLVLNPKGNHYSYLRSVQDQGEYEDIFFDQNAVFLERNSRDFVQRVRKIDANAERLVEFLSDAQKGAHGNVIKAIYYPTLVSRENYDQCRRPSGGYGELFSLTFHSMRSAMAFYDELKCAKGPSLGTNFTLASPFVILAHYTELEWAAQFGVESNLVRVSVGMEDIDLLLPMFEKALQAAA